MIDIYNSAFYDDYLRYGQCQGFGRSKESMQQSVMEYPKVIAYEEDKAVGGKC